MAHYLFEHPATSQIWMDKAGVTEIRMADDRSGSGVWCCNLVKGAAPAGWYGEGPNAMRAFLDALLSLKKSLDSRRT